MIANRFPLTLMMMLWQLLAAAGGQICRAADPPNLVIINIDDLGYADIGPFGSELNKTPNLNRMAEEGLALTSFYAAPVCSPSRAALMTGCYPKRVLPTSHVLFPAAAVGLNPQERTIAELLKDVGYQTACIGKWHLGDQPQFLPTAQGFDYYLGIPYSNDMGTLEDGSKSDFGKPIPDRKPSGKINRDEAGIRGLHQPPMPLVENDKVIDRVKQDQQQAIVETYTQAAVRFIREHHQQPFFLYLPHSAVHFPLYPGKSWVGHSSNGLYGDWVEEVDWSVGQVLDTLRELQISEKTLVIFVSDNGGTRRGSNSPLRGFKGSTWEGGMRVPALAWWPGSVPAGTSNAEIVSVLDILPTFAKLAGAALPATKLDGLDISPILLGRPNAAGHQDFYYFRGLELQAIRSGPWKLHFGSPKKSEEKDANPINPDARAVGLQLYNLEADVGEQTDVSEEHPDVVRRLETLAQAMDQDLGISENGPGVRPLGRVSDPKPFLDDNGKVRAGAVATQAQFP
ncbi:MAG: sulfatase [bacterium]|nr:sulfatase [bacterium]